MTLLSWLTVLFCVVLPAAGVLGARKAAKRDRKRFMADKREDDEDEVEVDEDDTQQFSLLDVKNAENVAAWRRRVIAANPQTIVVQRFPSEDLQIRLGVKRRPQLPQIDLDNLPAFLKRQAG